MKLTLIQALEMTAEMWDWLAEHPRRPKSEWPGWKKVCEEFQSKCACCQYDLQFEGDCKACPLLSLWPSDGLSPCADYGSPFNLWSQAVTDMESSVAAKCIADAARDELRRLCAL
jgi:hypothetical protein